MPLALQLVNESTLPDGGPVSFQLSGKCSVDIGRGAHLDWTLPDPTRFISNKHCEIRYKDGDYWLSDVSTNGTFLNGADRRMQAPHRLRNGDRFTIGHYLVAVTLEGAQEADDETRGAAVPPPTHVPDDQDLWADERDVQSAIDTKQLRATRPNAPFDWSADIPDPFRVVVADLPAQRGRDPASSSALDHIDWAGPPPLPQPPLPVGVQQNSTGPVVFSRRGFGRIKARWIIPAFGAGFLLTAIWLTGFFLTSSENQSSATTGIAAAVPHGRLFPQTSDTSIADAPELLLLRPTPNSPEIVASGSPAPFESAPKPLFPSSVQSPFVDQSTPPDQGHLSGQSALANPPGPESPTHSFLAGSAHAISNKPRPAPIFDGDEATYWRLIGEKRRLRGAKHRDNQQVVLEDYVLARPPQHQASSRSPDDEPTRSPEYIPVAADFLKAAAKEFNFVPERPATEMEFKTAYARVALSAGLTKDQIVRIYAFETGGNGTYDTQAGLEFHRPGERAVSPAIGYNQLLGTNSVELLAEHGDSFLQELRRLADKLTGPAKKAMQQKIEAVRRMVAFSRTVPDIWQEHDRLAKATGGGLGIHALMFDRDIGPLLQTQKLVDSLLYSRKKGHSGPLTAAELELMNLTGDGNGFDMILMPQALRVQVPTANFFQRDGYERNAIARRTGTVVALIAVIDAQMDKHSQSPGARELATAF
jgi:FHA domain